MATLTYVFLRGDNYYDETALEKDFMDWYGNEWYASEDNTSLLALKSGGHTRYANVKDIDFAATPIPGYFIDDYGSIMNISYGIWSLPARIHSDKELFDRIKKICEEEYTKSYNQAIISAMDADKNCYVKAFWIK